MRERDGFQLLLEIKSMVGKLGDSRMHAPLFMKHAPEFRGTLLIQAAICQADSEQKRVGDLCLCFALLGYGGQLLIVAHQYELIYGISRRVLCRKDADKFRFQYLRGFIDNR